MLEVTGLVKHFGGVKAVDGVNFKVSAGECVALIGPNGAGKSSTFACIAGQQVPTGGTIAWQNQNLAGLSPAARLQRGVARTFQVAQVFEALTVLQNVQLVWRANSAYQAFSPNISGFRQLDDQAREDCLALLGRTGLQALAERDAQSLPYGAKKRLELAIALSAKPALLLLDEPAAGLAQAERGDLMQLVKGLAGEGMAVLYTEHNMDAVAQVADRVLVLIEGRIAADGSFEDISRNALVRSRYLGERSAGAADA